MTGLLCLIFAGITAWCAQRKARNVLLWAIAGGVGFLIALIGLAFFKNLNDSDEESARKSLKREKIFCAFVIALGLGNLYLMWQDEQKLQEAVQQFRQQLEEEAAKQKK